MRTLDDLPLGFKLFDPRSPSDPDTDPAYIGDFKEQLGAKWVSTTVGRGGWEIATTEFQGEDWEKEEFFLDGLRREIVLDAGGSQQWVGIVKRMTLTRPDGEQFVRDLGEVRNRWMAVYTKIGDNQLTNGSAETGAWADYNSPSTNEQSTDWVVDGDFSDHIVADSANDGATIQTGMSVVANKGYQGRVNVYIVSGTWVFEVYRTDTGDYLARRYEDVAGENILMISIGEDNTYAGNIGLRIYCTDSSGEIYADNAVWQDAPYPAWTTWYEGALSIEEFGLQEEVLLLGSASDQTARSKCISALRKSVWAHSFPPDTYDPRPTNGETRLEITFVGYIWTVNNKHTGIVNTDSMSDYVSYLISTAQFVEEGVIEENTTEYQNEMRVPQRLFDVIKDITVSGDTNGDRWECGIYEDRKFDYVEVDETPIYKWRNSELVGLDDLVVEPWSARPGYVLVEEMPLGPEQISGYETDNPRVVYMYEVEFDVEDWLAGKSGLKWWRDREG